MSFWFTQNWPWKSRGTTWVEKNFSYSQILEKHKLEHPQSKCKVVWCANCVSCCVCFGMFWISRLFNMLLVMSITSRLCQSDLLGVGNSLLPEALWWSQLSTLKDQRMVIHSSGLLVVWPQTLQNIGKTQPPNYWQETSLQSAEWTLGGNHVKSIFSRNIQELKKCLTVNPQYPIPKKNAVSGYLSQLNICLFSLWWFPTHQLQPAGQIETAIYRIFTTKTTL